MRNRRFWRRLLPPLVVTLIAFAARLWQLDAVPPGWSDDELSNIFVIAQKVFEGTYAVYYTDATGLEAPYHVVSGLMLQLFGFNAIGIRLLSVLLGTMTAPLTYRVAKSLFGRRVGLLAAAAVSVCFWSLIYSRVNLRHISLPVMALATFYWFWRGISADTGDWGVETEQRRKGSRQSPISEHHSLASRLRSPFIIAGLLLGLSLYTYFAARGLPLILGAFAIYVALFDGRRWRRHWRGVVVTFLLALLVAAPLLVTLVQTTGADARVAEVAVPLVEAREGNFEPLWRHVRITLSMFHGDGDGEYLYNLPHRPVFGAADAVLLWAGVLTASWLALQPLRRRLAQRGPPPRRRELAASLLLIWWVAGITPGFLSVPPASLGHTILAQPATFILLLLPLLPLGEALAARGIARQGAIVTVVGLLLVAGVARRDLPDYFSRWPQRGLVRFLYHADVKDVARSVAQGDAAADFAISGLLAGPWDRLALSLALQNQGVEDSRPRWFDPRRAIFLALDGDEALVFSGYPRVDQAYEGLLQPRGLQAGAYQLSLAKGATLPEEDVACFRNGLCLLDPVYSCSNGERLLHLTWRVATPLQMPAQPLVSKPPPPGVYDGPRLHVFAQRQNAGGDFVSGEDGLWVDPLTLHTGDVFRQQHRLGARGAATVDTLLVGLYDPMTGQRVLTEDGRDQIRLSLSCQDGQ